MSLGGPTTTTQYNQQQNQNQQQQQQSQAANLGQSTITPNLPSWLQNYYQGMPGQQANLFAQAQGVAQKPLYGPQQIAQYQQNLNQQLGQASQNLQSNLARRGMLNSAAGNQAQTQLALGGAQQMGNYLAQIPQLNAAYQQQALGQLGNILTNAMNWKPPVIGQSTDTSSLMNQLANMTGSSQSDTSGQQTQQTSGGLLQSLLGGLMNAGLGIATGGLSNLAQGLSFTGQGGGGVSDIPVSASNPSGGFNLSQFANAGGFDQLQNQYPSAIPGYQAPYFGMGSLNYGK